MNLIITNQKPLMNIYTKKEQESKCNTNNSHKITKEDSNRRKEQ